MSKTTLSTVIEKEVKKAASEYCKNNGIKLQSFVEDAIAEKLEDELDMRTYQERKDDETIPFAMVLKNLKKSQ